MHRLRAGLRGRAEAEFAWITPASVAQLSRGMFTDIRALRESAGS
jgi:hypothetical protein